MYTNRRRILCTPRVIEAGASQLAVALMHVFGFSLKWLETGWKRLLTLCPERILRPEKDRSKHQQGIFLAHFKLFQAGTKDPFSTPHLPVSSSRADYQLNLQLK